MHEIEVHKSQIRLTEKTLRTLMKCVDDAKKDNLTQRPKKEAILCCAKYSGIKFLIDLEVRSHTQEAIGYEVTDFFLENGGETCVSK